MSRSLTALLLPLLLASAVAAADLTPIDLPPPQTTGGRPLMQVLRDRAKWFEKMDKPPSCLWWVPAGHMPSVAEGRERLEHFQTHGATPFAFSFSHSFPAPAEQETYA